ncbi:unnamed protein product [Amaranthus hypochondriacus]
MMKTPTFKSLIMISLLLFLSLATSILAQEVEDESEFNYIEGDEKGPENWGNIKEEWATCNTGQLQSPIDLLPWIVQPVPYTQQISRSYYQGLAKLKNRGHDIKLEWLYGNSKIRLNDTEYVLLNCHWHSPSEHAINGKRYPLEGHFVHQGPDNSIAVIGFLYDLGQPDPFLSSVEVELREISNTNTNEIMVGSVNPLAVQKPGNKYYRYMGSLTTPACNEGVIWTVETKIGTVSNEQLELLRDAVHDGARYNARPLQPINGRRVYLYKARHWFKKLISTLFAELL